MVLKALSRLFRKKEEKPEYAEIKAIPETPEVAVRVVALDGFGDVDRIQQLIREGDIVFARIKELRSKDIAQLKRAVDRIKKTCAAIGGDVVGVNEDFLIIAPGNAKIVK